MSNPDDCHEVGRHGRLDLTFAKQNGKTVLRDSYATMPMHCLPPHYPDNTGCAYVFLVNPTGGFVGGDRIEIEIALHEDSHVLLTTQSAAKIYRSIGPFSSQTVDVQVQSGSTFEFLPSPTIPFADSRHRQATRIHLEHGSRGFIVDSFTTGRVARGEHLAFGEFSSSMAIEYAGKLLALENFTLRPKETGYGVLGLLESYCVSSSVHIISHGLENESSMVETLQKLVDESEGILGGVSTLRQHGLVARLLGTSTRHVERAIARLWARTRSLLFPEATDESESLAVYRRLAGP